MREHLAPNLEAEAGPEYLPRYPFLRAEHVKAWFFVGVVHLWLLNVHPWPCLREDTPKAIEMLRIVIPDVPEVPCSSVVKQGETCRLLLVKRFIVIDWTENRDKANGTIEVYCPQFLGIVM